MTVRTTVREDPDGEQLHVSLLKLFETGVWQDYAEDYRAISDGGEKFCRICVHDDLTTRVSDHSIPGKDIKVDIQGYDIDGTVIKAARENAREAGVDHLIHFQERAVKDLRHPKKYGFVITNPPYGERLEEKENLPALYREFGDSFKKLDSWSAYMITSYEDTERYFGRKADKNRKIYNGMLKTYFYQFNGPKPPKNAPRER